MDGRMRKLLDTKVVATDGASGADDVTGLERKRADMLLNCRPMFESSWTGDGRPSRVAVSPVYPIIPGRNRSDAFSQDTDEDSDFLWVRYDIGMTAGDFPLDPVHAMDLASKIDRAARMMLEIREVERRIHDAREAEASYDDADDEPRFWVDSNPDTKPFGESTVGVVDEEAGGVVAYFADLDEAERMVTDRNGGAG